MVLLGAISDHFKPIAVMNEKVQPLKVGRCRSSYKVFSDLLTEKTIHQTTKQWTLAPKTIELRDTKVQ